MNIKETINQMINNKRAIEHEQRVIDKKKEEFEDSIKSNYDKIRLAGEENLKLENTKVRVGFADIMIELSKHWDCKVDDIRFNAWAQHIEVNGQNHTKEQILERIRQSGFYKIFFTFVSPKGEKIETYQNFDLDRVQTNGKTLAEKLSFSAPYGRGISSTVYQPNFSPWEYVFESELKSLIRIKPNNTVMPQSKLDAIMLKIAFEKEKEKEENSQRILD